MESVEICRPQNRAKDIGYYFGLAVAYARGMFALFP